MDAERLNRLDTMIEEGRIIRRAWTEGHERACLLAALSPEAGKAESASACPAEVMPRWLARLTPWLDDSPSKAAWPALVRRYASLARRWGVLDAEAWERARIGALIAIVTEARQHVPLDEAAAHAAIDEVLAWLRRGAPASEQAAVAQSLAAAREARESESLAPPAGACRSEQARRQAAADEQLARCCRAASWALAWSADAPARAAAFAASSAEWLAAGADRISVGILDAIEREIVAAEGER